MNAKDHVTCYFKFWQPSVSRRITFYFIIFGVIIFIATSILYMVASKNQFRRTTNKIIHDQIAQLENSGEPDFIWHSVNQPNPGLNKFMQILVDLSASFYAITDISIYSKVADKSGWHRLYFSDSDILHVEPIRDPAIKKLEHRINGKKFSKAMASFFSANDDPDTVSSSKITLFRADDAMSMFVNITGPDDKNFYFLKLAAGSEGIAGFFRQQIRMTLLFLIVMIILSRIIGYRFARKIARPIEELSQVAADVAGGDLSQTAPLKSKDEIGVLSQNFNKMIEGLREWERIKIIEFELEKGQKIQKDFLPTDLPHVPNWEIATYFSPAGKVAGDFYDAFTLPDGCIGLVIADVCDKGVGSALYMALFRSLIRVFAYQAASAQPSPPGDSGFMDPTAGLQAVAYTNNYIARTHEDECMFATMFFGVLNPNTGILHYINAGHEPLYVVDSRGIQRTIGTTGPAVGMMPDQKYNIEQFELQPGEVLVGYTDGVTEARSPDDELFTRGRLQKLLEQPAGSASELLDRIKSSLFSFIGVAPRSDDVTLLALQRVEV